MYQKKERKKKKKTIPRDGPGTHEKTMCVKCNKTIKHFILCNLMRNGVLKNNIAFQCPITHHIALNEVQ